MDDWSNDCMLLGWIPESLINWPTCATGSGSLTSQPHLNHSHLAFRALPPLAFFIFSTVPCSCSFCFRIFACSLHFHCPSPPSIPFLLYLLTSTSQLPLFLESPARQHWPSVSPPPHSEPLLVPDTVLNVSHLLSLYPHKPLEAGIAIAPGHSWGNWGTEQWDN